MNDFIGYNPNTYMNPYPTTYPQIRQASITMPSRQLDKVNGIESAKAFPTSPNSMVALFDANDDVFYIKQKQTAKVAII